MSKRQPHAPMVQAALRPRVPEKAEQQQIVNLVAHLGGSVYVKGVHRRRGDYPGTMQTPGIPDLDVFLPPRSVSTGHGVDYRIVGPLFAFVEVKAADGRLSPAQRQYQALCVERAIPYIVGGLDAFIAWLIERGYVHANQFPHYRQPKDRP